MEILTAKQSNTLIKLRNYYRETEKPDNSERTIEMRELLDIINTLESFDTLSRKLPELHGWSVTLRGFYKYSDHKNTTALQFIMLSKTYNDADILAAVKKRFGGRNSLLDGFEITDYQLVAIDERAMCVGTSIEGKISQ